MAKHIRSMCSTFLAFFFLIGLLKSSNAASIGVYWGQEFDEGSIEDACNTLNYAYLNIAFLSSFGSGQTPVLNLNHGCNPSVGGCTYLGAEIKRCQEQGVKVFLSLGGMQRSEGNYTLSSADDAKQVAAYLWNNYLGGKSNSRPFGDAVLDGIDFSIHAAGSNLYWDVLAQALKEYSPNVLLSAAPRCLYPDHYLSTAIDTGLFDYLWVQYFNNYCCQYGSHQSVDVLVSSWVQWSKEVSDERLFLNLPAAPEAARGGGYIPPDELISIVLPAINATDAASKFGGVMLWNKYYDHFSKYSDAIKPYLDQLQPTRASF